MQKEKYKTFVYFIAFGQLVDFEKLDSVLGDIFTPVTIERKGERKSKRVETYFSEDKWIYKFCDNLEVDLGQAVADFTRLLSPRTDACKQLFQRSGMSGKLYIAVYKGSHWPAIKLIPKSMELLVKAGLTLELDIIG